MNYSLNIQEGIKEKGWALVPVIGDRESPSFAYTVGLTETYQHAEIIVFGLPPKIAHSVIFSAINVLELNGHIESSILINTIVEDFDVVFVHADFHTAISYMLLAADHYQDAPFEVLQLVWPDTKGKFPWEKDYELEFEGDQILLGTVDRNKLAR